MSTRMFSEDQLERLRSFPDIGRDDPVPNFPVVMGLPSGVGRTGRPHSAVRCSPRGVVLRHTWAPRTVETRTTPGPAVPRYANAVIGILREGGFSVALAHHALHILGSRVLGFSQDLFDDSPDLDPEAAAQLVAQLGATLPYAAEMAVAVTHDGVLGACDDDVEFEFALDFILDGLNRLRSS